MSFPCMYALLYSLIILLLSNVVVTSLSITSSSKISSSSAASSHQRQKIRQHRIAVVGGGASGMFAATAAANCLQSHGKPFQVIVFEGGKKIMTKVAISGGGRCNVLHDTSKSVSEILGGYPRGKKELTGVMTKRFSPAQAYQWFTDRGVQLKTESDGRMFPKTDSSQTIIDVIANAAMDAGVLVRRGEPVVSIVCQRVEDDHHDDDDDLIVQNEDGRFHIQTKEDTTTATTSSADHESLELFDAVIMATGSSKKGHDIAKTLGHKVVDPVPSLFTLDAKNQVSEEGGTLHGLAGLSVQHARVTLKVSVPGQKKKKIFDQEGPILITHHGLSGPAPLRLSAFAAREFHAENYHCDVFVHWAPQFTMDEIETALWQMTKRTPRKLVSTSCPIVTTTQTQLQQQKQQQQEQQQPHRNFDGLHDHENNIDNDSDDASSSSLSSIIPKRLWAALTAEADIDKQMPWSDVSKKKVRKLANLVANYKVGVTGKGIFKEEFVTAGGISLKEINMKTMESKRCEGLFFCGEMIDVDGITGGFNFMNCWSTGYVAGQGAATFCSTEQ